LLFVVLCSFFFTKKQQPRAILSSLLFTNSKKSDLLFTKVIQRAICGLALFNLLLLIYAKKSKKAIPLFALSSNSNLSNLLFEKRVIHSKKELKSKLFLLWKKRLVSKKYDFLCNRSAIIDQEQKNHFLFNIHSLLYYAYQKRAVSSLTQRPTRVFCSFAPCKKSNQEQLSPSLFAKRAMERVSFFRKEQNAVLLSAKRATKSDSLFFLWKKNILEGFVLC